MADHPFRSGEGDLDASGPRSVVYCHRCGHQWYQDEHGVTCPQCYGEIIEIVTPESDPRPGHERPPTPPNFHSLRNHDSWADLGAISDPEEADIEEHVTRGPGGSIFFSQTFHSTPHRAGFSRIRSTRREVDQDNNPEDIMRGFQEMIGNMVGSNVQNGAAGRSGPETLFPGGFSSEQFRMGGNGGPSVVGGRFSYTTAGGRAQGDGPRPVPPPIDGLATYASPSNAPSPIGHSIRIITIRARSDQLARIIAELLGHVAAPGHPGQPGEDEERGGLGGMPPGLHGLFASLFNPANAVHGDAVYSQEAMDRIMSTLMEQHPTSNAPGPATPEDIAALPKKILDEEALGPEGKGECTVCMDDVHIGDEVIVLPCNHWYHEICATSWLNAHNTCPICRKGIGAGPAETPPTNSRRSSQSGPTSRNEHRNRRLDISRTSSRRDTRNEARLDSIRDRSRLTPTEESSSLNMPGAFTPSYRRRDSEMSENQRDTRRGHTSGSDRSRRSSRSDGGSTSRHRSGNGSGGPMSWIRDRFSSNGRRND
ncbi:hypothetical protein B7494_g650 [Chlorociboria aeruginascens]|nr:hypothetical protein B7494_g650 [Chlorociboria aeruginascens]